jgi:hypothetical protein
MREADGAPVGVVLLKERRDPPPVKDGSIVAPLEYKALRPPIYARDRSA